jgi:hypothetical protein
VPYLPTQVAGLLPRQNPAPKPATTTTPACATVQICKIAFVRPRLSHVLLHPLSFFCAVRFFRSLFSSLFKRGSREDFAFASQRQLTFRALESPTPRLHALRLRPGAAFHLQDGSDQAARCGPPAAPSASRAHRPPGTPESPPSRSSQRPPPSGASGRSGLGPRFDGSQYVPVHLNLLGVVMF